jgi:two-component system probable response regulator PhcQ
MELKQALEMAGLRKERDQLLREKLSVLQRQTIAARIGLVRALSASLIGPERFQPVETYLSSAALAGVSNPEPDWLLMDYADLVAAESRRSGSFGYAVAAKLAALRTQLAGRGADDAVAALAATLAEAGAADVVRRVGDALVWTSGAVLAEYLGEPVNKEVSAQHAAWLAGLLWLDEAGGALKAVREGDSIVYRAAGRTAEFAADRLAVWIEQF